MPSFKITIGVPYIYVYKITGKEESEDFINTQCFKELTPTTGPIHLKESWSKSNKTTTTLTFDVLSTNTDSFLHAGDIVSLFIAMPPDCDGEQEVLYTKFALVKEIQHVLSTKLTTEYYSYEIIFSKDSFVEMDETSEGVWVRLNNGPDFFIDTETKERYHSMRNQHANQ